MHVCLKKMPIGNSDKDNNVEADESAVGAAIQNPGLDFYVITVNYTGKHYLRSLIGSLRPIPLQKKLIIVNHSPWECLDDLAVDFEVQIINQENKGYGAGLNRGLREIRDMGAIALLCNPDITILNPDAIKDVIDYMNARPRVACVLPSLVDRDYQPIRSCREFYSFKTLVASRLPMVRSGNSKLLREHFYIDRDWNRPFEVDWGCGGAMFFKTSLFQNPLSFDERFFLYFEDVDFCSGMWQEGFSVVFHPKLVCRHDGQKQSHKGVLFFARHLTSLIRYARKYGGLPRREDLQQKTRQKGVSS
jgi:GT2 family glycosyltransferase